MTSLGFIATKTADILNTPRRGSLISLDSILAYGRRRSSAASSCGEEVSHHVKNGTALPSGSIHPSGERMEWSPDFFFNEFIRIMRIAFNNQLDEALLECDLNLHKTFLYPFAKGSYITILASASLDKDLINQGIEAFKVASQMANEVKPKRSWKKLFVRTDYDSFTDEQIIAECIYGLSLAGVGCLTLMSDRSYTGIISAALYLNRCYGTFSEAMNILKYRKKWQHMKCKKQFESGVKLGVSIMNMIVSFAPSKLVRVLMFVGFSADLDVAIENLHAVVEFTDSLTYLLGVLTLVGFYGFLQPVYGLGEIPLDLISGIVKRFLDTDVYGGVNNVLKGVEDTIHGRLKEAIDSQNKAIGRLSYFGNLSISCHIINMLNYSLACDWHNASKSMKTVMDLDVSQFIPSFLVYIYTSVLRHIMDEEDRPELEEQIENLLEQVKTQKGFFVLKRAYQEQMVSERSKQFSNDVKNWLLPGFEVLYLGNFYCLLDGKPEYLNPILNRINLKLDTLTRDDGHYWDKHAYLTFLKGVVVKHLHRTEEALDLFHEIMSLESVIKRETHVPPQACYEMGLIHRKAGNVAEAKRWFVKVTKYGNYFSEKLLRHRCAFALDQYNKS